MGALLSILGLTKGRLLLIGGLAVAALVGWFWLQSVLSDRDRLEAEKAALETDLRMVGDVADANRRAFEEAQAEHQRALAAIEAERKAYASRLARIQTIREEIDRAPDTDDGPVAPVLRGALERLRGIDAGAPGNNGGATGQATDPGEPSELPATAEAGE